MAVLDWVMPGGGGPVATREILGRGPGTRIVAMTTPDEPGAEADSLRAGARISLVKRCRPDELLRTIRDAAAG